MKPTDAAIVLFDPTGKRHPGHVLLGPNAVFLASTRDKVVSMPVVPELLLLPIDGFFRRDYGDGWEFGDGGHKRGAPMILRIDESRHNLAVHWACEVRLSTQAQGRMQLLEDVTCPGPARAGAIRNASNAMVEHAVQIDPKTPERRLLRGVCELHATATGYLPLVIGGAFTGARVMWSAVSVAPPV